MAEPYAAWGLTGHFTADGVAHEKDVIEAVQRHDEHDAWKLEQLHKQWHQRVHDPMKRKLNKQMDRCKHKINAKNNKVYQDYLDRVNELGAGAQMLSASPLEEDFVTTKQRQIHSHVVLIPVLQDPHKNMLTRKMKEDTALHLDHIPINVRSSFGAGRAAANADHTRAWDGLSSTYCELRPKRVTSKGTTCTLFAFTAADLGSPTFITRISVMPRQGFESAMKGCIFEVSNSRTGPWTRILVLEKSPQYGKWNSVVISPREMRLQKHPSRFLRLRSGNANGSVVASQIVPFRRADPQERRPRDFREASDDDYRTPPCLRQAQKAAVEGSKYTAGGGGGVIMGDGEGKCMGAAQTIAGAAPRAGQRVGLEHRDPTPVLSSQRAWGDEMDPQLVDVEWEAANGKGKKIYGLGEYINHVPRPRPARPSISDLARSMAIEAQL